MKNDKPTEAKKIKRLPIPKPSNNWLEEFDCNKSSVKRISKEDSVCKVESLKKIDIAEKYRSNRGDFKRR